MRTRIISMVLVVATAALLAAGLTACGGSDATGGGQAGSAEPVEVQLFVRGALNQITDSFQPGQEVRVKDSGTLVGTITDVQVTASRTAAPTSEGELKPAESPVFSDITLTIEGEAVVSDKGYQFAGRYLYINDEIQYLTPFVTFPGSILSMERAGQ